MSDLPTTANPGTPITVDGVYDMVMKSLEADVVATGNFAGATVEVQEVNPLSATKDAATAQDSTFTAPFTGIFRTQKERILRFKVSNTTGPTSILIYASPLPG